MRIAAAALAALAFFPIDAAADSPVQQNASRNAWKLVAERAAPAEEKLPMLRQLSPAGVLGTEFGWVRAKDLKPGGGLQLDLSPGWALCADWDRYRPRMAQLREPVDTFLLGFQITFP